MKRNAFRIGVFCLLLINLSLLIYTSAAAGELRPKLQKTLEAARPDDEISIIIQLADKADIRPHMAIEDKRIRRSSIVAALKDKAETTQKPVMEVLQQWSARKIRPLWLVNGIAVRLPARLLHSAANLPGVDSVALDETITIPSPVQTGAVINAAVEWNITKIKAPSLWSLGYMGWGIVVANMDTGVDLNHPDVRNSWRGWDPLYANTSWFDPNGEHPSPFDNHGHGTATMSVIVGGSAGGTSIGVAPGAKWIAVKIFNDAGQASESIIIQGFQWILNPDGNVDTDDAPDVVNNSWGFGTPNACIAEVEPYLQTLKAAGISVIFSAGNDGPSVSTSESPANAPSGFAVGATNSSNVIASFSSRGPSACDGSVFPEVVAPGASIKAANLSRGSNLYAYWSGTSFSAPHVAGAIALLRNAKPSASVAELEQAIKQSAVDLGAAGLDNTYGYGLVDALGAFHLLLPDTTPPTVTQFRVPSSVYGATVPILALSATDNSGVTGYLIAESATQPQPADARWSSAPPSSYTLSALGSFMLYAWARDAAGNISSPLSVAGTAVRLSSSIGVFWNGTWYFDMNDTGAWNGPVIDKVCADFGKGLPNAIPVLGDWTGSGVTRVGVYAEGTWYLDIDGDCAWNPSVDRKIEDFGKGLIGAIPVVGDWTESGISKIGVYWNGRWYLDRNGNGAWDGPLIDIYYPDFGVGLTGAIPVVGNWTGSGVVQIGVYWNGTWYFDINGNGAWNGLGVDTSFIDFGKGLVGAFPVVGVW